MSIHPKLAGFWTRFWAYTIDIIVLYAVSGIFIKPIFRAFDIANRESIIFIFYNL